MFLTDAKIERTPAFRRGRRRFGPGGSDESMIGFGVGIEREPARPVVGARGATGADAAPRHVQSPLFLCAFGVPR